MRKLILSSLAVAAAMAFTETARAHDDALHTIAESVPLFWRDAAGNPPASDSTPLYDARFHNPALAPDGHQLTVGEFNHVSGNGTLRCVRNGTRVNLHVSGLVPNGVYTVWTLVFNGPFPAGPNGAKPAPFGNLVGLGPLGAHSGTENHFQADANGEGDISALVRPGALYAEPPPPFLPGMYNIQGCLLDEVEVHMVGVYHFDSMTYGSGPGYNHGAVEQFGFRFVPSFENASKRSRIITAPPTADPVYDAKGKLANRKTSAIFADSGGKCDHKYGITMPDGTTPICYQQWKAAKGSAKIECFPAGSLVTIKLHDLIPNALYTIWVTTFNPPGITPDLANITGVGALGGAGGHNIFHSDANGDAMLTAVHPAGPLSLFGETGGCLLDEFQMQLWGAYHLDANPAVGPGHFCDYAIQFGFDFSQAKGDEECDDD